MATPPILLPLWPRAGVTETLGWLTDVMTPEDGAAEERTEMRVSPRQTFEFTYYIAGAWQARIDNIIYGGRTLQWYVPAWQQVQNVGAITVGQTSIACETRYSEFRTGGLIMLWESPDHYQILEMDAVTSDTSLDLIDVTEAFGEAWLTPVRVGYLDKAPTRRFNGRNSAVQMTFNVEDNEALTVGAPTQYLGADLYTDPGLLDGGQLAETIQAQFDIFDEGLGLVSYRAPWTNVRPARVHRMMGETAAENWAIREFLHRRQGKSIEFWQPSFEADFRLNAAGAVTTTLDVYPDDYIGFASARQHVAIETGAGWLPRRITGAALLGPSQLRLTFDSTLGGVQASSIKRVCYLGKKRLDTDRVELTYNSGMVSMVAVNTVEIAP